MKERLKWIQFKGKKILNLDYSNLSSEDLITVMNASTDMQTTYGRGKIYVLNNLTNVHPTKKTKELEKNASDIISVHGVEPVKAVVGYNGFKRIVKQMMHKDIYYAKNENDAKEWLLNHYKK